MAASTTRIVTPNGRRYLTQLCKHWAHKFEVVQEGDHGVVPFAPDRRCVLAADDEGIVLTIEAAEADALPRLQEVVFDHLKRFAFREDLGAPAWTPAESGTQ